MKDNDYKGIDKLIHFCICCILSLYSTELAIGAALGKEYSDSKSQGNHWCWWDILADINGIALGTIIRIAIIKHYNWI